MNVIEKAQQRMTDYSELVKALRHCSHDGPVKCNECKYYGKEWPFGCEEEMMRDAADAIEALIADVEKKESRITGLGNRIFALGQQLPKRGEWNNHDVACLLAEMFGDDCACNLNGIDEWLPQYCEFAETCCPNPVGVACWEQFLKHRAKMEVQE